MRLTVNLLGWYLDVNLTTEHADDDEPDKPPGLGATVETATEPYETNAKIGF